jgi:hypothetical protein
MRYHSPCVHLLSAAGALTVGLGVAGAQAVPLAPDPHAGSSPDALIRVAGDQDSQGGGGGGNADSGNGSTGAGNGSAGATGDAAGTGDASAGDAGAAAGDSGGNVGAGAGADVGGTDAGAAAGAGDDGAGADAGASAGGVDAGASVGSGDGSVGAGAGASVGGTGVGASAGTGGGSTGAGGGGSTSTGATGGTGAAGSGTATTGGASGAGGTGGATSGPSVGASGAGSATTSVGSTGQPDPAASIDAQPTAHDSPIGASASIDVPSPGADRGANAVQPAPAAPSARPIVGCSDPARTGACASVDGAQVGTLSRPASSAPARTAPSTASGIRQGVAAAPQPPAVQPAAPTGGGLGISLVDPVRRSDGLVVQGVIVNTSGRAQAVPPMQLSLVNEANQVVQRYKLEPPAVTLADGEHKAFKTVIQPVPPDVTRVTTAFIAQPPP